ncbi:PREDICTED: SET and MYND domain-containing protein 4 [Dipodomys ordii]|uniref:SET and MYND domain-containing protein 4 n=1 Tax=Dipodomys ordii TaxID=10020 RepID=A0A1S3F7F2_DIPOR|nr:PREDICTED: SET and MYND domain-containing protein 4 [Dipodomys ordii]
MDLPVDEWKSYILQKWSLLPKAVRVTISTAETLSDIFLHSSSLLQPEDEMFLKKLSRGYSVGKDPDAPFFYREEGNKKFQEKNYIGAAVLYSKGVSHCSPDTEDISLCYANRSAALFRLGQYEVTMQSVVDPQEKAMALPPPPLEAWNISRSKESFVTSSKQVRLATGIFPVVSLLNHSCSPNTSLSFAGTVVTIRATQQIGKGQEILHCYGPHESRMSIAERQQKLKSQYFFDCSCPACHTEELRTAVGPRWEAFCCNSCRALMKGNAVLSCDTRSCAESISRDHLLSRLQQLQQHVEMAQKLLRNGKLEQAIQQLLVYQQDAKSFLWREHTMVGKIEDNLAQAYATLGDWQKSAAHLQKSLQVVEARYGPTSVEVGHELFKLAQVLFNGFAVPEALNTIQKAEKVLMVHVGPQSSEIKELQEMRSCLLDLPPALVGPSV